ncbi:MAG: carboxylesterase family protein [Acidobacteriota bacterium]|nr:carboxylesterase family protein [Acidobacteriota bacterium]
MTLRAVKSLLTTICVSLSPLLAQPALAQAAGPQVRTDHGVVAGEATADHQVLAFKGIPYAAPPVGKLRWQPPQPAAPWQGVRQATDFGPHCVQLGGYPDMQFHDPGPSEDCLTLNVWQPAGAKRGSLPVMVWIYGGGFATGGTSEHRQDGQYLAHRGVVVVSMNYRLGIFGFLVHPELTAESAHHASGNYGLMDVAAALAWVQKNIAAFGGDPKNVTIFGESAGSFAVSSEMASPLTRGMISKAIGESGGALYSSSLGYLPRADRETRDSAFLQQAFGTSKLAELRRIPTEDIVRAATAKGALRFGPDVDGYFLPEPVPQIYAEGKQAHIPMLAGWNGDEGRYAGALTPTIASFTALAQKDFGEHAADFLAVYPAGSDEEAKRSAGDYGGDKFIAYSTWRWIEGQVQTGHSPVYRYFFTLGSPGDRNHPAAAGAFHSDDIEYVFGTLDSRPDAVWRPEDRRLSDQMGAYWTNFAKTGNPNGPGLPKWPVYGPTEWQVMHLNGDSAAAPDTLRPRYLFLDTQWGKEKN